MRSMEEEVFSLLIITFSSNEKKSRKSRPRSGYSANMKVPILPDDVDNFPDFSPISFIIFPDFMQKIQFDLAKSKLSHGLYPSL